MALLCFAFALALGVAVEPLVNGAPNDFLSFYYAAQAIHRNLDLYDPSILRDLSRAQASKAHVYPYLYPPVLAQALQPLAVLPISAAHGIWLRISLLAVALSSTLVWVTTVSKVGDRSETNSRFINGLLLTIISITILPVKNNLAMGQVNPIVFAPLSLMVASYLTARPVLAGIFLTAAILIKAIPIVFVGFFLARRAFKVINSLLVSSTLVIAASLAVGGLAPWRQYLEHTAEYGFKRDIPGLFPAATIYNFSPLGELARLVDRDLATNVAIGVAVGALLIALVLAVRARGTHQERMSLCLVSLAMLFASPLTYLHHMLFLSISVAIWLPAMIKRGSRAALAAAVILLGVAGIDWPGFYGRMGPLFRLPEFQALNLYAIVALYCMIAADYYRHDFLRTHAASPVTFQQATVEPRTIQNQKQTKPSPNCKLKAAQQAIATWRRS